MTVVEILVTGNELGGERRVMFEELQSLFEKWQLTDDVWEKAFLESELYWLKKMDWYKMCNITVADMFKSHPPTTKAQPLKHNHYLNRR